MSRRKLYFHPPSTYQSFQHNLLEPPGAPSSRGVALAIAEQPALSASDEQHIPILSPRTDRHVGDADERDDGSHTAASSHRAVATPSIDVWLSRRNLDTVIARKSLLIFANGMFGLAVTIVLLQVGWDGQQLHWEDEAHALPVLLALKMASFLSTLLLLYQLLDRKRLQVAIKYRDKQRRKTRASLMAPSTPAALAPISFLSLLSLRPATFRSNLWLSLVLCSWHVTPLLDWIGRPMSPKWGLLMLVRLYLLLRVIRDYSDIWRNRRSLLKLSSYSASSTSWWLSVKSLMYRRPLALSLSFYLLSILLFGYLIYIQEREVQPLLFTFPASLFLAFQCITIDWASDVYELYVPASWSGKYLSLAAAASGLLLMSFLIGFVAQSFLPSRFEEAALNCISVEKEREKEREHAARLIQFVWRSHRRERELNEKLRDKNPRLFEEVSEREEKEFMEEFMNRSKALRNTRRERIELEQRVAISYLSEREKESWRHAEQARVQESQMLSELKRLASRQDEMIDLMQSQLLALQQERASSKRRRRKKDKDEEVEESDSLKSRRRRNSKRAELDVSMPASPLASSVSFALGVAGAQLEHQHEADEANQRESETQAGIDEYSESGERRWRPSRSLTAARRVRSLSPRAEALASRVISALTSTRRRSIVQQQQQQQQLTDQRRNSHPLLDQ